VPDVADVVRQAVPTKIVAKVIKSSRAFMLIILALFGDTIPWYPGTWYPGTPWYPGTQHGIRGHNTYFAAAFGFRTGLRRLSARPVSDSSAPMKASPRGRPVRTVALDRTLLLGRQIARLESRERNVGDDQAGEAGHAGLPELPKRPGN
jgi:hypothetical protein